MTYANAHAALIDDNNKVVEVIVIPYLNDNDDEITAYCNSLGLDGRWIDTSYLGARRGKYAGIGYTYDAAADVFIAPQLYPSWILDDNNDWQPPTPKPEGNYYWNETELEWVAV